MSKIINYKYRTVAADLINAVPTGPIQAFTLSTSATNQTWDVVSVGKGPDGVGYITIQNLTTGTYANPDYVAEGASVVGGFNAYQWQQKPVPGGWYQILTNDGQYGWFLTAGQSYSPIVLKQASYTGEDAQWAYEPAE